MLTTALVQMQVRAGRPDDNVARMLRFLSQTRRHGAQLVVFPELCISGYILGDCWEQDRVVEDFAAYSEEIREASAGLAVVFGNVAIDPERSAEDGRLRKYNAAWVCVDRQWIERQNLPCALPCGVHPKTLQPNYRFFDDNRHFYSLTQLAAESGSQLHHWMVPYRLPIASSSAANDPAGAANQPARCTTDEVNELRLGVQLCEDLWYADYRYAGAALNTLPAWKRAGATLVVNLSASPWTALKNAKRHRMVSTALAETAIDYYYVNNVGAQNNGKNVIVFDGATTAYAADRQILAMASQWTEELLVVPPRQVLTPPGADADGRLSNTATVHASTAHTTRPSTATATASGASQRSDQLSQRSDQLSQRSDHATSEASMSELHSAIRCGLLHLDQLLGGTAKYLIGVSGGVDSSLVAALLADTFTASRVLAINMPTRFNSALTQRNARHLCSALGIDFQSCSIETLYAEVAALVAGIDFARHTESGDAALLQENIQARIRGADVLAAVAAKYGCVFTNNANKTELALGYATLYGDVNGAIAPIADLYKTGVFALARYLNQTIYQSEVIPWNLLNGEVVPSAELSAAQDITKGCGDPIRYDYHDCILRQFIEYRRHPLDLMQWYLDDELLTRIGYPFTERFRDTFASPAEWLADLEWIDALLRRGLFKRIQSPPLIVLSKRAFGFDLRESQLPPLRPRAYAACRQAILDL